eukprot:scaffold113273_cov72-Phaeocystis_antarctica.AAC.2
MVGGGVAAAAAVSVRPRFSNAKSSSLWPTARIRTTCMVNVRCPRSSFTAEYVPYSLSRDWPRSSRFAYLQVTIAGSHNCTRVAARKSRTAWSDRIAFRSPLASVRRVATHQPSSHGTAVHCVMRQRTANVASSATHVESCCSASRSSTRPTGALLSRCRYASELTTARKSLFVFRKHRWTSALQ